ncbi:SRPBCC family protein [Corynebacterium sp. YIM 101645]|uniref:SRPBCC family protein n=1 Tax=Corynebacterium lemuris TaxID=1859292 RepID=A0ABT2FV36_9CORY|nr:SRPBCC family protein [Corynebacterium lemuris]MCS5478809.1 SRPBCC family protein [Corynebacterium lemuris]
MTQTLTTDAVERVIRASPEDIYAIVSDITRTPELSPEVIRVRWIRGATGPEVGARFLAINSLGRIWTWPNFPVVITAEPGREFAISRTEPFFGTLEWRYHLLPQGEGNTLVTESYTVTRPLTRVAWFILEKLIGSTDRAGELRSGMAITLERLAELVEHPVPPSQS